MPDPLDHYAIRDVHSELSNIPVSQNEMTDIIRLYLKKTETQRLESQLLDILNLLDQLGQNIRFRSEDHFGVTLYSGDRYLSYVGEWVWA